MQGTRMSPEDGEKKTKIAVSKIVKLSVSAYISKF